MSDLVAGEKLPWEQEIEEAMFYGMEPRYIVVFQNQRQGETETRYVCRESRERAEYTVGLLVAHGWWGVMGEI